MQPDLHGKDPDKKNTQVHANGKKSSGRKEQDLRRNAHAPEIRENREIERVITIFLHIFPAKTSMAGFFRHKFIDPEIHAIFPGIITGVIGI
jgi:hypothetical protein